MADENGGNASQPKISPLKFALIVAVILGGIYFYKNQEKFLKPTEKPPVEETYQPEEEAPKPLPPPPSLTPMQTIKIATWDLTPLDFHKLGDNTRADRIAETIAEFDIVAIQGVLMRNTLAIDEIVRRLETKKKQYAYAAYPESLGRVPEYMVILYNKATIRIDLATIFEVIDSPLTHRPLIASFCTVAPPADKAFTFTLVSIKIDEERRQQEVAALGGIYKSLRDRILPEDDLIMLGNFAMPVRMIDSLATVVNLVAVHSDFPTTSDGALSCDNILFDRIKTTEYVEKAAVVDLMAKYNLQIADIYPLTSHLPVYAEFSIFESGNPD